MEIYFTELKWYILRELDETSHQEVGSIKKHVVALLDEAIRGAVDAGFDLAEVDSARFAICALIDEKMLENSAYKDEWQNLSLQQMFYGTSNAGTLFYHKLKYDIQQRHRSAWMYWWCLIAGFKGEYCYTEYSERRLRIVKEIYRACHTIPLE